MGNGEGAEKTATGDGVTVESDLSHEEERGISRKEVSLKDTDSGKQVKIDNSKNEIWKNNAENSTYLT